jgi:hypothetical protein
MSLPLKKLAKWLLPTPVRVFEWGVGRLQADLKESQEQIRVLAADLKEERRRAGTLLGQLQTGQAQCEVLLKQLQAKSELELIQIERIGGLVAGWPEASRLLLAEKDEGAARRKMLDEICWAQVFNSTIADSAWLKDRTFSPGRWAVGYPALYLLYRILNDVRPRRILELGLGESTKMTAQYAASREDAVHAVVEHDERWLAFFKDRMGAFTPRTEIVHLDMIKRAFRDDPEVVVYDRFAETLAGRKYDFVLIDGPIGGGAKTYARVDMVDLLPDILAESFVLVLDDYNRKGEQNAAMLIRAKLQERNIPFCEAIYSGMKDVWLICSADLGFLRSL